LAIFRAPDKRFGVPAQSVRLWTVQGVAKLLSKDEARRIAVNIAKLQELFGPNALRQA
jgi:hypothetical protein